MSDVIFEQNDHVLTCTLNRPEAHNGITADIYRELLARFSAAENDDSIRVIVTRAAGKSWCVGADSGDLRSMPEMGVDGVYEKMLAGKIGLRNETPEAQKRLGIGQWVLKFASLRKPKIASIQGAVAGGGLGLALLHDFRIASENAKFTTAFGRLGIGVELGISCILPELVGRQTAMDLLARCRIIDACEADKIGLIDQLVSHETLEQTTQDFAQELARQSPLALMSNLAAVSREWKANLESQLEFELVAQRKLFASEDFKEGIDAFLNRRPPNFRGK